MGCREREKENENEKKNPLIDLEVLGFTKVCLTRDVGCTETGEMDVFDLVIAKRYASSV